MFFPVYDARLWRGPKPVAAAPEGAWVLVPMALQIDYTRELDGSDMAERSLLEMRRQERIDTADAAAWLAQLRDLFPDVKPGDRLSAIGLPPAQTFPEAEATAPPIGSRLQLFFNGQLRGRIDDTRFARLFIGIWLSPQTSQPALRTALLGDSAAAAAPR